MTSGLACPVVFSAIHTFTVKFSRVTTYPLMTGKPGLLLLVDHGILQRHRYGTNLHDHCLGMAIAC